MLTIHQIEHLVWMGLIDKISKAEKIVLLDTVDYERQYFHNRNKIRTSQGWQYITIPVQAHNNHIPLKEILITNDNNWQKKYLNAIKLNYSKSKYFEKYYSSIDFIINQPYKFLIDINASLLYYFLKCLDINKKIYLSSELNLNPELKKTDLLLEICQKLKADTYLSGASGKDYLQVEKFNQAGIQVEFHQFEHPIYEQVYTPFIPGMSVLDYLFNCGGKLWIK